MSPAFFSGAVRKMVTAQSKSVSASSTWSIRKRTAPRCTDHPTATQQRPQCKGCSEEVFTENIATIGGGSGISTANARQCGASLHTKRFYSVRLQLDLLIEVSKGFRFFTQRRKNQTAQLIGVGSVAVSTSVLVQLLSRVHVLR